MRRLGVWSAHCVMQLVYGAEREQGMESLPVHMLYRLAGLAVSTLWITFASTVNTCVSNLYGIVVRCCDGPRSFEQYGEEGGYGGESAERRVAGGLNQSILFKTAPEAMRIRIVAEYVRVGDEVCWKRGGLMAEVAARMC